MTRGEAGAAAGGARARARATSTLLVQRTEGWPAGLYLAALSLATSPTAIARRRAFAGDDRIVADYLRDELLAALSARRA